MEERIRVAIAEDIDILRRDLREAVQECARLQLVGEARCGRELVELVQAGEIDVVVTDIEMDDSLDGIRAAQTIAQISPETAIVFLTIHEDDETVYKAFSVSQSVDYVLKSETHERITQHIIDIYEGKTNLSTRISAKLRSEFYRLRKTEESLLFIVRILGELTPTEKQLIRMLLDGKKVAQIAAERNVEVVTVKTQIGGLLKKFGVGRSKQIVSLIRNLNIEYLF